jgi:hypothetical protein
MTVTLLTLVADWKDMQPPFTHTNERNNTTPAQIWALPALPITIHNLEELMSTVALTTMVYNNKIFF